MFADDVALISDTSVGLQRQLNILQDFCSTSHLKVNIHKTKLMLFKRGGRLSRLEKWYYNNTELQTVNSFSYAGVTFTPQLSLNSMATEMTLKGKRVLQ